MRLVRTSRGFFSGGDGEAVKKVEPGSVAFRADARFADLVDYMVLDVGYEMVGQEARGAVVARAPPEGIRRKAKEVWQYKILSVLQDAGAVFRV